MTPTARCQPPCGVIAIAIQRIIEKTEAAARAAEWMHTSATVQERPRERTGEYTYLVAQAQVRAHVDTTDAMMERKAWGPEQVQVPA